MPTLPNRLCSQPGCPNAVQDRYCDRHKDKAYVNDIANRGTSKERGYDGQWRKLRAAKLCANPLCERCEMAGIVRPATMVHHLQPIALRPDLRLDWDNLTSLCEPCHDVAHSNEAEAERIAGCDINGLPIHPDHPWQRNDRATARSVPKSEGEGGSKS